MQMSLIFFVTKEIGDISMPECFHLELSPFPLTFTKYPIIVMFHLCTYLRLDIDKTILSEK